MLGGAGCHHHDGHVALGPQDPADVQAVDIGHHHVEHHEIRALLADLLQRRTAVARQRHRMSLALQVHADQLGLLGVVLSHQDPRHAPGSLADAGPV